MAMACSCGPPPESSAIRGIPAADPLTGHDGDQASDSRGPAQSCIGGEQTAVQRFCQRDVGRVVGRQILPEFPNPIQRREYRKSRHSETLQRCQSIPGGASAELLSGDSATESVGDFGINQVGDMQGHQAGFHDYRETTVDTEPPWV